jgi:hypothetical protein
MHHSDFTRFFPFRKNSRLKTEGKQILLNMNKISITVLAF